MLSQKIKELRKSKGWNQADLADKIGVTRHTIINWEKGVTWPDEKQVGKLLNQFNITFEELNGGPGKLNTAAGKKEGDDLLDHPLVKSYVEQINQLQKLVAILERENAELRARK